MREVKPTQKPVPSSDIKDLFFNSGLLDIWATSLERKYIDRFGNCHLTAAGMEWIFNELVTKFKIESEQALLSAGYAPAGTFQEGAEVVSRNGTILWKLPDGDGDHYRWDGDLPKTVPAGSTPQSTGGIGKGAWVSVGDASLRSDVKNGDGSLIGLTNGTLKEAIYFITPEMFDAVGDGVTDDSDALQSCIDYAFENKLTVVFRDMYGVSKTINVWGGSRYADKGVVIKSSDSRSVGLVNITDADFMLCHVKNHNDSLKCYNVCLDGLDIKAKNGTAVSLSGGSYNSFRNLHLTGKDAFIIEGDAWINDFEQIIMSPRENGFVMKKNGTSNRFDRLFVVGDNSDNNKVAYQLSGEYCTVGALACDSWGGEPYKFIKFIGHIGSIGCEFSANSKMQLVSTNGTCNISIGTMYLLSGFNHTNPEFTLFRLSDGNVVLDNITIWSTTADKNFQGNLYTAGASANISIRNIITNVTFKKSPVGFGAVGDLASERVGIVRGERLAIGNYQYLDDRNAYSAKSIGVKSSLTRAIYFDSYGHPRWGGVNKEHDFRFAMQPKIGDIFLESNPSINNNFGSVVLESSADLALVKVAHIPIASGGKTVNRPTSPVKYSTYFDEDLNRLITWNGLSWV